MPGHLKYGSGGHMVYGPTGHIVYSQVTPYVCSLCACGSTAGTRRVTISGWNPSVFTPARCFAHAWTPAQIPGTYVSGTLDGTYDLPYVSQDAYGWCNYSLQIYPSPVMYRWGCPWDSPAGDIADQALRLSFSLVGSDGVNPLHGTFSAINVNVGLMAGYYLAMFNTYPYYGQPLTKCSSEITLSNDITGFAEGCGGYGGTANAIVPA